MLKFTIYFDKKDKTMPVVLEDRPIDKVREEVVDQLVMNYSHGELSLEAFERRLDQAMETDDPQVLVELTADLDLVIDQVFVDSKKQQMGMKFILGESEDAETIFNIFSGSDRSGEWELPKEIRVISIFSGSNIDLTDAIFRDPIVRVKIFNLFSGDNIYVPENVNVKVKAFCIFGGIDNSVSSVTDPTTPTIIIEGYALFSGINIEIRKTLKERFVIFADKLKEFLS